MIKLTCMRLDDDIPFRKEFENWDDFVDFLARNFVEVEGEVFYDLLFDHNVTVDDRTYFVEEV